MSRQTTAWDRHFNKPALNVESEMFNTGSAGPYSVMDGCLFQVFLNENTVIHSGRNATFGDQPLVYWRGVVAMRGIVFVVLLLSFGLAGEVRFVNAERADMTAPSQSEGASASPCPNGSSTSGPCGTGAPLGITYAVTTLNWTQTTSSSLTGGSSATVILTPCPRGVDYTSGAGYQVYITDGASSEAVAVTSGSTGSGNCSIAFTPFFSHTSYTIGSASSGIQETINAACGTISRTYWNSQCNVTIPANGPYLGSGSLCRPERPWRIRKLSWPWSVSPGWRSDQIA